MGRLAAVLSLCAIVAWPCSVRASSVVTFDVLPDNFATNLSPSYPGSATAEIVDLGGTTGMALRLAASDTYVWDGGVWRNQIASADHSSADATWSMSAPAGAVITFRAKANYGDAAIYGTSENGMPTAFVRAYYLSTGPTGPSLTFRDTIVNNPGWSNYSIALPGINTFGPVAVITHVSSLISQAEPVGVGNTKTINVNAYFDDFQFESAPIPEPLTVLAVLCAAGALGAYVRRRLVDSTCGDGCPSHRV